MDKTGIVLNNKTFDIMQKTQISGMALLPVKPCGPVETALRFNRNLRALAAASSPEMRGKILRHLKTIRPACRFLLAHNQRHGSAVESISTIMPAVLRSIEIQMHRASFCKPGKAGSHV